MDLIALMRATEDELTAIVRGILNATSGANYASETQLGLQAMVTSKRPVTYTAFINFAVATTANYGVMGPDPLVAADMATAPFYLGFIDHSMVKDAGTPPNTDQVIIRGFAGGTGLSSSTTFNKKVKFQGVAGPEIQLGDSPTTLVLFQAWRADVVFSAGVNGTYAFNFIGLQLDITGN